MITTLKKWEIRDKSNKVVSAGSLKLNGYTYELHTLSEVILVGIEAERHYEDFKEMNKMLAEYSGDTFIEVK